MSGIEKWERPVFDLKTLARVTRGVNSRRESKTKRAKVQGKKFVRFNPGKRRGENYVSVSDRVVLLMEPGTWYPVHFLRALLPDTLYATMDTAIRTKLILKYGYVEKGLNPKARKRQQLANGLIVGTRQGEGMFVYRLTAEGEARRAELQKAFEKRVGGLAGAIFQDV